MTSKAGKPQATVVISTKNRRDDLRRAVSSCLIQTADVEVLVVDDGSTDGTAEMLTSEFPTVRLIRHESSTGYIVARNEGAHLAYGEFLFSIDDDAEFTTPNVVSQTMTEFDCPNVGAVAIPYADVNRDGIERQRTPDPSRIYVADRFVGTAYAVRREVFLGLGGYRPFFFHQGEESDFCIRLLDSGYIVRLGNADMIHHFESPKRDTRRMDLYGRRNDILFAVMNTPLIWLPLHLTSAFVKGVLFGFRVRKPLRMMAGLALGVGAAVRFIYQRKPVTAKTFRLFWRLRRKGSLPLSELQVRRPQLCEPPSEKL